MILSSIKGIKIDKIDADLNESRWSLTTTGYPRRGAITVGGAKREPRLHRVVVERILGRKLDRKEEIDHINGNPLDNRRQNLRVATHRENLRNQQNRRKGISQYVGVAQCQGRWRAYLVLDNRQHHVGVFSTKEEAAWMRDQYALALHGEFARLNFDYIECT